MTRLEWLDTRSMICISLFPSLYICVACMFVCMYACMHACICTTKTHFNKHKRTTGDECGNVGRECGSSSCPQSIVVGSIQRHQSGIHLDVCTYIHTDI